MIRTCAADSNSLTMDTELSRVAHSCGLFDFVANASAGNSNPGRTEEPQRMKGCIDVCSDSDGCNRAETTILRGLDLFVTSTYLVLIAGLHNKDMFLSL